MPSPKGLSAAAASCAGRPSKQGSARRPMADRNGLRRLDQGFGRLVASRGLASCLTDRSGDGKAIRSAMPARTHRTRDRCHGRPMCTDAASCSDAIPNVPSRPPDRLGKHRSGAAIRHTPDAWPGSGLRTRKRRPQGSAFSHICRRQTTACRNYSAAAAAAAALAEALAAAAAAMSSLMRAALPSRPRR